MKSKFLLVAALTVTAMIGTADATDTIAEQKFPFRVEYKDGTVERYVAIYRALYDASRHETGGPAVLDRWPPKLVDDRQCHWTVNARVQRDLCAVSRAFGEQCEGRFRQVFQVREAGSGQPMSWTRIQGQNCGDARGHIDNLEAQVRSQTTTQFNQIVTGDLTRFLDSMRGAPDVVRLERQ